MELSLSSPQLEIVELPVASKTFLEGPAGCGKTTAAVERLLKLMEGGVPGDSILLLIPQRTLAAPYYAALRTPGVVAGGMVTVLTVGGLAQRLVELFWPLVAEEAGFARPEFPPVFLTLETAQYYMAYLLRPLIDEQGLFDSVTIDRNRLYSQIIDNLNKAAVVGFPHNQIGRRLKAAWAGDPGQARIYEDAQACAFSFRQYCLDHNLLDFSLQLEVFLHHLWPAPICQEYLLETYRHLLVDNLEEDTPVAHDLLAEWLPHADSATLVYDQGAGYRRFLGADPGNAYALKTLCDVQMSLDSSFVNSKSMHAFSTQLANSVSPSSAHSQGNTGPGLIEGTLTFEYHRFYPQMLDWVAEQIAALVNDDGLPPGEIVILAPFLSDSLRFALTNRLDALRIPVRSHRPSRSLREEPATQCLLTLAAIAHPSWEINPARFDLAYALLGAIQDLDLVRAQLLAEIVYTTRDGFPSLSSFDNIRSEVQERITYRLGERYENLRLWLAEYSQGSEEELDHFLSRIFGEVLSQPGYGFHLNYPAGEVTANLVESVQKFRWAVGDALLEDGVHLGREYLRMVQDGVIAAQYIRSWSETTSDAVLLAPAYTFLMSNRPVDVQFWLDVGSRGWSERLYQPLTHPYVLSRAWAPGVEWTDADEVRANEEALEHLVVGLTRRCRRGIYLGLSELGEGGFEQRGPLLQVFNRLLRHAS